MNTYYLVKNSKKISNVLVTGDGGDEIFGGYTFRYSKFNNLVNETSSIDEKIQSYLNCHERDWVPDQEQIFGEKMAKIRFQQLSLIFSGFGFASFFACSPTVHASLTPPKKGTAA